jgi:hypothetical protein
VDRITRCRDVRREEWVSQKPGIYFNVKTGGVQTSVILMFDVLSRLYQTRSIHIANYFLWRLWLAVFYISTFNAYKNKRFIYKHVFRTGININTKLLFFLYKTTIRHKWPNSGDNIILRPITKRNH